MLDSTINDENLDVQLLSLTEEEAILKFKNAAQHDPYPSISPALLNPSDIKKYILASGIIYPFDVDNLTNATYKVPLIGDIYNWEKDGRSVKNRKHITIEEKDKKTKVILKKNSITYFHISTTFRVPYYLVFRFNLTVSLAQKGLLLGTGPIIDPGFEGRIMIPIHNLTANDYELVAGSGLIRVEVTKLSSHSAFDASKSIDYRYKFPEAGKNWSASKYFEDINHGNPIVSSIPEAMEDAKASAVRASEKAEAAEISIQKIKKIAWGGAIISILAIVVGMVYPTWSMINDTSIASKEFVKNDEELKSKLEKQEEKIKILETCIENLAKKTYVKN